MWDLGQVGSHSTERRSRDVSDILDRTAQHLLEARNSALLASSTLEKLLGVPEAQRVMSLQAEFTRLNKIMEGLESAAFIMLEYSFHAKTGVAPAVVRQIMRERVVRGR